MESKKLKIAVTGAGGFLGKRFLQYNKDRFDILPVSLRERNVEEIDMSGLDAIIHLAGKAHEMQPIPDQVYYDINYTLTKQLAEKAKLQEVPHFIFISSVKVYGENVETILHEKSHCDPADAYAKSKLQAEEMLRYISTTNFKVAIVRPPLIYGPEVKGNMLRLLDLASKKYPLPFGNIRNARSMVFIDNLVELINAIIFQGATGVFIAGDDSPVSTDMLIRLIRKNLGVKDALIDVPGVFRTLIRKIRPALYFRLFGSYAVDNSATNKALNFVPPFSTEYGIEQMVEWYRSRESSR